MGGALTSSRGEELRRLAALRPDTVLALQRSVGNRSLSRLLDPPARRRRLARQWPDARAGGWNAQDTAVAGTLRIPVADLSSGFPGADPQKSTTKESAKKRAIVVVPDTVNLSSGSVEVLLHFHGMGVGYRERFASGTVRDAEDDRIEQQIVASGRNMVAVLAQGASAPGAGRFAIGSPLAYVNDVLALALAHIPAAQRPAGGKLQASRLVISGWSAGGRNAVDYAAQAQTTATEQEWVDSPPLLLFDGINGPGELATLKKHLAAWLAEDLKYLTASSDPAGLLARRGLKLRSTWSAGSDPVYKRMNLALDAWLAHWFSTSPAGLPSAVVTEWRQQYRIDRVTGEHNFTIGTGRAAKAGERDPVSSGVTGKPSTKSGVPQYSGGGNLETALRALRPNTVQDADIDEIFREFEQSLVPMLELLEPMLMPTRDDSAPPRGLQRKAAAPVVVRATPVGPRPVRADESGQLLPTFEIKKGRSKTFTVFVPLAWIGRFNFSDPSQITDLKVHVFFAAADATGNRANDVLVHGLRGASNLTEWITIAVHGTDRGATIVSDADVTDCLKAVNITSPVANLRLTGHSRGVDSLFASVISKSISVSALDRIVMLDEFQTRGTSKAAEVGKVTGLIKFGIPASKITAYQVTRPGDPAVAGISNWLKLSNKCMNALGCVRLIQDAMALDSSIAAKVAANPDIAAQVELTEPSGIDPKTKRPVFAGGPTTALPPRGAFTTKSPPPPGQTNIDAFCQQTGSAIDAIFSNNNKGGKSSLLAFINGNDLAHFGGFQFGGTITAHHFFVAEIAHELYE